MSDKPKIRPKELKDYLLAPELPADFSQRTVQAMLKADEQLADYLQTLEKGAGPDETVYEDAFIGYLEVLQNLGRHQEVVDGYYKFGKTMDAEMLSEVTEMLAKSLIKLGRPAEAVKLLEDDMRQGSSDQFQYAVLAEAYDALGNPAEAIKARQKACQAELETLPGLVKFMKKAAAGRLARDHQWHALMSDFMARLQDLPGAIKAIRDAIALDPTNSKYLSKLADYEKKQKGPQS